MTGIDLSLRATINLIENDIKANKDSFKIKDSVLLLSTLNELDGMIGLKKVKDSIASQIRHLLLKSKNNQKEGSFLNAVLAGPPGVGKSEIAVVYAKIMYSLGYLENKTSEYNYSGKNVSMEELQIYLYLLYFVITVTISLLKSLTGVGSIVMFMILTTIVMLVYVFSMKKKDEKNLSDLVTIVNGAQLKAEYVGWTAKKVINLCQENAGKRVIFIDEAYTIMTDPRDAFGMEALTALNQYMSENPRNCVVVFAGYRNLLDQTIFKFQPGLESRITWNFECEPYSPQELTKIYIQQLNKEGLIIDNEEDCLKKITKDHSLFESHGRSTARLVYFTKLELENNNFINRTTENNIVTSDIVESSIKQLFENRSRKNGNNGTVTTENEFTKKLKEFMDA